MKLVLHIGTEKTGTTTIQEYLYQNRDLLEENGYYIPKLLGEKNHRKIPSYCMREKRFDNFHYDNSINTVEKKYLFIKNVERDLTREFSNIPDHIHTVIITSEHFHSRLIYQNEVDKVKELLAPFFNEFEILVYLRRQIDLSVSLYSTFLKRGAGSIGINEFVKTKCKPGNHFYNYERFLSLWENTFGLEAINVRLFAKNKLYKQDLLLDFVDTVTENLSEHFWGNEIIPEIKNESLNCFGQDMMQLVNSVVPPFVENRKPNIAFVKLRSMIMNNCSGQGNQPNYNLAEIVMNKFEKSNSVIQKKYFPDHDVLFDQSLKKFSKEQHTIPKDHVLGIK